MVPTSLCVFCGSSAGRRPAYRAAAEELGASLARRGIRLVYGGGKVGLMGAVADAALAAGGEVVGVIPQHLMDWEVGHLGLTELEIVGSMHERKARMADLSDAFVALPGGFGTLEEFCEVLTWSQLGLHPKPCGLLNVEGFYDPLLQLFEYGVAEGFILAAHRHLVLAEVSVERLLARLEAYEPALTPKFIPDQDR
jgi:uncharacterized protein (TIGR00730 family)